MIFNPLQISSGNFRQQPQFFGVSGLSVANRRKILPRYGQVGTYLNKPTDSYVIVTIFPYLYGFEQFYMERTLDGVSWTLIGPELREEDQDQRPKRTCQNDLHLNLKLPKGEGLYVTTVGIGGPGTTYLEISCEFYVSPK